MKDTESMPSLIYPANPGWLCVQGWTYDDGTTHVTVEPVIGWDEEWQPIVNLEGSWIDVADCKSQYLWHPDKRIDGKPWPLEEAEAAALEDAVNKAKEQQ